MNGFIVRGLSAGCWQNTPSSFTSAFVFGRRFDVLHVTIEYSAIFDSASREYFDVDYNLCTVNFSDLIRCVSFFYEIRENAIK